MAQQNKMYALPQELKQRYFQIFVPSFPLEVRHYCAQWIEDQQWFMPELDPNHPLCDQYASRLVNMLVDQIRNQSEQIRNNGDHMPFAMALQRCAQTVKDDFMSRPMDLVRVIQNHLTTERHILEKQRKCESPMMADQAMESQDTEDESQKVQQTFEILKTRMQEVNNGLDGLQQHQEMCNLQVQQFVRTKAQLEKWTQLVQAQPEYTSKLEQGKQEYTTLYHNVLSQQTRIRSERLEIAVKQSEMLTPTFVVTEQPPQVLKKQTKFAASVRLLIGGKLNFHMQSPKVTVTIVNEKQASQLVQNPQEMRLRQQKSGEILNNMMAMEYHDGTHMFSAHFRNMQLKKITRPVKTSRNEAHAVTEEKFALLFQTSFSIDSDKQLDVFSMSLPVVVIVHGNQEPDASATIMWDNAFAPVDCKPFVAPEQVKWCQLTECIGQDFLSKMLKDKGRDMTKPRGLSADDRLYLAEKLYGMEVYNSDLAAVNDLAVTWTRFNKEDLRGKDFTFWQWYYSAAKLLKEDKQLKQMWNSR
ncbi:PREDICTED: signal transducer and activator of transcription 5A-like [Priapulus caudatus]|uniref:Signal transducer and activator of transcription 5A-like n=1 Tax=Priapulus caudatus TaxID=37621 RepID=A0ABM1E4Q4_PRICU|nr:PREDICTED: signal transducer and activator of transcription 5A-like [Priapulus caudatus]